MRTRTEAEVQEMARRFAACPDDMREWAEALGYQNLKSRVESGAAIGQQAHTTLTLLLAGMGGSLAVGVQVLLPGAGPLQWGAAVVAGYLSVLAVAMVHWCIKVGHAPAVFNRPSHLLMEGATTAQARAGELANLDERIAQQADVNNRRANALNAMRYAAAATPVVFAAGAAAAVWGAAT